MTVIGWFSIAISVVSLAPSFVPGAMSIIGMLISLGALVLSAATVSTSGMKFYKPVLVIVLFGVFFVNDALRLWSPLNIGNSTKVVLYILVFTAVLSCGYLASRQARSGINPNH